MKLESKIECTYFNSPLTLMSYGIMKSKWFKLIAFILGTEKEIRRARFGKGFYDFEEKRIENGLSTSHIHNKILYYLSPKKPVISSTGKVLQRMQTYGLVYSRKINIGKSTAFDASIKIAKWWKGIESVWSLSLAGRKYFNHTKNETETWIKQKVQSK